jgi:hypothetical protein
MVVRECSGAQQCKGSSPLKSRNSLVKERRYIVCLNEEERRKDAHDRQAIVAHLKEQLRSGDKSLVGNKGVSPLSETGRKPATSSSA